MPTSMLFRNHLRRLVISSFFLALALVLPLLTGQIKEIGNMLCPMHLPVLLCGFFCGWYWGFTVGFVAPLFRSLTLGMPVLFPGAVCMSLELATYGFVAGMLFLVLPRKRINTYVALLVAMLAGRLVWGGAMAACLGVQGQSLTLAAFFASAVTNAIPGIVIQIVAIPLLVDALKKRV